MKLIIAGGGTGGHIFPGLAIQEEFLSRSEYNESLFVGAVDGMEEELFKEVKVDALYIRSGQVKGVSLLAKVGGLAAAAIGVFQSIGIIRRYAPDFVLGVGGYASVPVVIAAWLLKVPRAVQEQNSFPGLSNRLLARISSRVFLSFASAEKYFKGVDKKKFIVAGNPLRKKLLAELARSVAAANANGKKRFQILVVGGSQGARRLNKLMMEGLECLAPVRDQLKLVHMSGAIDQYDLIIAYSRAGIKAKVSRFIDDMGKELREADLVISRAGAGAVFELAAAGKPSILVPYPFAADDHQRVNAEYLSEKGAALVFDEKYLTGRQLCETIIELFHNPARLQQMAEAAKSAARPEAAKIIVDEMMKIMGAG